jgi:hypothetical protein
LTDAAVRGIWATPQSQDCKHDGANVQNRIVQGRQLQLSHQTGGKLNPAWVACLMGFPPGWFDGDATPAPGWPAPPGPQHDWEPPRTAPGENLDRRKLAKLHEARRQAAAGLGPDAVAEIEREIERELRGFNLGHRNAQLRALGNAVVPQVAELVGRWVRQVLP